MRTGSDGACWRCSGLEPEEAGQLKIAAVSRNSSKAQGEVARLEKKFADAQAPFWPVIDGKVFPGDVGPALAAGAGAGIDIMIGTTREEMAAFYCIDQEIANADAAAVDGVFADDAQRATTGPTTTRSAACAPRTPMRRCSAT